jgi:translation initiation factor 1A
MPNQVGGKNYKKSKHGGAPKKVIMIDRQPDQIYGRILRNLGGDRMIVFCNDGKQRVCHIRGGMRKRVWMKAGDLVLISPRDFEKKPEVGSSELEKGDIIAKYDDDLIPLLKKLPDFNPILLKSLETADGKILQQLDTDDIDKQKRLMSNMDENDVGIEFAEESEKEEKDSEAEGGVKGAARKGAEKEEGRKRKEDALRDDCDDDDTFDIDDI